LAPVRLLVVFLMAIFGALVVTSAASFDGRPPCVRTGSAA
jgi:hypothetical protein